MQKILLIEDRVTRQQLFMNETSIKLDEYNDILDNCINHKYTDFLQDILRDEFDLDKYSIIITHKSAFEEKNIEVLSKLKKYCEVHQKPLVFFSGGISVNYYLNDAYESLELNSKTFYSSNLTYFLKEFKANNKNILMLCYGKKWRLNVAANILEKTNNFIEKKKSFTDILYSELSDMVDMETLHKLNLEIAKNKIEDGWIDLENIESFRDDVFNYISELADE
ncbi:hypothetical protein JHD48_08020 [Sulfurimonas sp. SAG-AH-194-I05]|nr:hypothetical protein [Sulfurimonas sp. SAG-AH-194-I05]MDF1875678.1 hypothetical protein [Sulfurimonas sp. SAG-AH-194-I05]